MKNVMDILRERGFVKQTVFEDELYRLLGEKRYFPDIGRCNWKYY